MIINNIEIQFSITDVNQAAAFDAALKEMEAVEKTLKADFAAKKMSYIDFLKGAIAMLKDFFVKATGVDVLGECSDYIVAQDIYFCFLDEIGKAKDKLVVPYSADRVR